MICNFYLSRSVPVIQEHVGRTLRRDTVLEAKATLKVVRTRLKRVLIYSKIDNAFLCSLPWTHVAYFISKGTTFCSYLPAPALSAINYRAHL